MDTISSDSIRAAIVLIPGFLSVRIRDFFWTARRPSAFDQFMEAIAFSVANFTLFSVLANGCHRIDASIPTLQLLFGLGVTSIVTRLLSGIIVGRDWHYRAARRLRLTRRTGRADVWQDVFEDIRGSWLTVYLADGRRVLGWARYYSDEGKKPSLFLRQASWVNDDGSVETVDGEGIIITESAEIRYVEFLGEGTNDDEPKRTNSAAQGA